ncbi:DEAD/DEAH box helicase [Candidatus Gracilibacteria bacterium]|nr:DEAD/DEAH box helicase [Candidatus Gracilibacteria bacterium]
MSVFVALDLETTGVNHSSDAILEYAFVKFDAKTFEELDTFSGFIHPGRPIPDIIQELTGIEESDIIGAPSIADIKNDIESFIGGSTLVGHNIEFDIGFLKAAGINISQNPTIDTFPLANSICSHCVSLILSSLCEYFDIDLLSAHRALDDTRATYKLFEKLTYVLEDYVKQYPDILGYLYSQTENIGDGLIYTMYIKPHLSPFQTPLEDIRGDHIMQIRRRQILPKSTQTDKTKLHVSSFEILKSLPKFEYRESQKMMCDIVDTMYTGESKIAVEAPTGTGKTFAYLIGALLHAKRTGLQTCIATSTKLLQDQICEEDMKYLQKHLPFPFTYTKITGKKNYFSLHNFYQFLGLHKTFSRPQLSFFIKLYLWSLSTPYGELRELEFYGDEYKYLPSIDASNLAYDTARDDEDDGEFYKYTQKKAELSDIVITNAYVLLQDINSASGLFSRVDTLICDEAHSLEDVVSSSSFVKISSQTLHQLFGLSERKVQKYKLDCDLDDIKSELEYGLGDIFHEVGKIIGSQFFYNARYKKYLFQQSDIVSNTFLVQSGSQLIVKLQKLELLLRDVKHKKYFLKELQLIDDIKLFLHTFFTHTDSKKYIYIGELLENGNIELSYTILNTGEYLKNTLWQSNKRILLTSATLFIPGKELYSNKVLGIDDFDQHTLPPVFDYRKQSYIFIPNNLTNSRSLCDDTRDFLKSFFKIVSGKTLMLCTSYAAIKELYISLHGALKKEGIHLIAQGFAGGKNKHLESYMKDPNNSILIGTDSFWQGVDISGDALQYLVIHKLPFTPPSDPIFLARSSLFEDSFYDYAIPKTSIKLRQGLGRLIRSHTDTGMILFLDDRVISQKWGKYFLDIFPRDIKIFKNPSDTLIQLLSKE